MAGEMRVTRLVTLLLSSSGSGICCRVAGCRQLCTHRPRGREEVRRRDEVLEQRSGPVPTAPFQAAAGVPAPEPFGGGRRKAGAQGEGDLPGGVRLPLVVAFRLADGANQLHRPPYGVVVPEGSAL
jgi:hypothetical protein